MFLFSPPAALAQPARLPKQGEVIVVHGRLFCANGAPSVRIWRVGTKRVLGVASDESTKFLPQEIRRWVDFDSNIYGDFTVEFLADDKDGEMASVKVLSAKHLVVEDLSDPDKPKIFKVRELRSNP